MSRIVFATDPHLNEGRDSLAAVDVDIDEIAALRPDLLVQGGDACLWTAAAGDHLRALLARHELSVVHTMGNHDTARDQPPARFDHDFVTQLGPRNTCTDLGDTHVITLNTCRMQPQYSDWRNVRGEVADDDLAWLDATLTGLDRDRPLLLFVHIPLATTYPERRGADRETTDVWRVTNADAVHQRLARWAGPVVVGQGHLHENEHLHRDGVHYVSVVSVCGRWWQAGAETRCPDGSPRGWIVLDVESGDVRLGYRAARAGADWQGEIVHGDGQARSTAPTGGAETGGPAAADGAFGADGPADGPWLDLFFGDPAEAVEIWRDGRWVALPPPTPRPVDETFTTTHRWTLPAGFDDDEVAVRTRLRGEPWDVGIVRSVPQPPAAR